MDEQLFDDNEPVWDSEQKQYTVPMEGTYNIWGFVMDLKPGDIVKFDEKTGVPYITSPSCI